MQRTPANGRPVLVAGVWKVFLYVFLGEHAQFVGDRRAHGDISRRKILPGHMHQILENCKRNALCHIEDSAAWRIPAATYPFGAFAVQPRVNSPADPVDAQAHLGGNVVFNACEDPFDLLNAALLL